MALWSAMPEPRVVKFGSGMARSTALTEARLRLLVSILAQDLRSPKRVLTD